MKSADTSHQILVGAATGTLNACIAQLQDELVGMTLDILAASAEASGTVAHETLSGPRVPFLETIDTLHKLITFLPADHAQKLKSKVFGIEDLWALTDGFMRKLASSKSTDIVMCFELTDRCTGRTVPVALPALHYNVLADEFRKPLRELKKLRKAMLSGRGDR